GKIFLAEKSDGRAPHYMKSLIAGKASLGGG
ncbi:unnamed protein product, partial [marine sediment metagenome]